MLLTVVSSFATVIVSCLLPTLVSGGGPPPHPRWSTVKHQAESATSDIVHQHRSLQLPSAEDLFQRTLALINPNCNDTSPLPTNASTPSPNIEFSRNSYLFSSTDSEADGWNVSFIELPSETIFVESIAYNPQYADDTVFVIGQQPSATSLESFLYAVNVPSGTVTQVGEGPLMLPNGVGDSTNLTFYGSALTAEGILYATAFNRNSVLYYDLTGSNGNNVTTAVGEISNLPVPNDLALDPNDPTSLYVAGGTFRDITNPITARHASNIPGKVYRVDLTTGEVDNVVVDNLRALAGIEITANKSMWISQLYNNLLIPGFDDNATSPKVAWTGSTKENTVWFSDNLDTFDDGRYILSAVYGDPVSSFQVDATIRDVCFAQAAFLLAQIIDAEVLTGEPLPQAVLDPEVSLALSNTFVVPGVAPEPLRIVVHDDAEAFHFEIDLANTRAQNPPYTVFDVLNGNLPAQRYFFSNQLTHMTHVKPAGMDSGYIVGVNFETPRLIVLSDQPVYEAMYSTGPATASPTTAVPSSAAACRVPTAASLLVGMVVGIAMASGSIQSLW